MVISVRENEEGSVQTHHHAPFQRGKIQIVHGWPRSQDEQTFTLVTVFKIRDLFHFHRLRTPGKLRGGPGLLDRFAAKLSPNMFLVVVGIAHNYRVS